MGLFVDVSEELGQNCIDGLGGVGSICRRGAGRE